MTDTQNPTEQTELWREDALNASKRVGQLEAENAAMRKALEAISEAHLGDQPAASGGSDYDWACRHIARLRGIALNVLASTTGGAS